MSKPWYRTARWKQKRLRQLRLEPLCKYCLAAGDVVPATVADHVVPHRWDEELFWHGQLQSLCAMHHSSTKQSQEAGTAIVHTGVDGYPIE